MNLTQSRQHLQRTFTGQKLADALETLGEAAANGQTAWSAADLLDIADNTPPDESRPPMSTHPQAQSAAPAINLQTPGPLETGPGADTSRGSDHFGPNVREIWSDKRENKAVALVLYGSDLGNDDTEGNANARALAAGFNLLDKTGRALGLDAAELGEGLDLAALIRAARNASAMLDKVAPLAGAELRAALSTLPGFGSSARQPAALVDVPAVVRALQCIHDNADHALGTNADDADKPEVMRIDLRAIRERARAALSTLPALP